MPVYEYFGNVGLAIGLLILGGILMFWAFSKFKKFQGKPLIMLISLGFFITLAFVLQKISEKPNSVTEQTTSSIESKISSAKRPKIQNSKGNIYLDKLEQLLNEFKTSKQSGDTTTLKKVEEEYNQFKIDNTTIYVDMANDSQYQEFALYNANLIKQIDEIRLTK